MLLPSFGEAKKEALLISKWLLETEMAGLKMSGITAYKKNKTWKATGSIKGLGEDRKMNTEGTWVLVGDKLTYTVTKTNVPDLLEVGEKWTVTILQLDKKILRYRDEDHLEFTEKRVGKGKNVAEQDAESQR